MYQQEPFYPDEDDWNSYPGAYSDLYVEEYEWSYQDEMYAAEDNAPAASTPEMGVLIGIAIVLFFVFVIFKNGASTTFPQSLTLAEGVVSNPLAPSSTPTPPGDPLAFAAPYTDYTLTQGLHGQSYGHLAIDLAAGRGTPILSPINGVITGNYTDQYGNTTLVIENEVYRVLLLHGDYFVQVDTQVQLGQQVGTESNHGYTTDMAGNRCYGREWCGNHTHLNVFDKRTGANTNPLDLIRP
ncbi:MAG: hypothetical protein Fur0022_43760 [Anaerolineales bacterium]